VSVAYFSADMLVLTLLWTTFYVI